MPLLVNMPPCEKLNVIGLSEETATPESIVVLLLLDTDAVTVDAPPVLRLRVPDVAPPLPRANSREPEGLVTLSVEPLVWNVAAAAPLVPFTVTMGAFTCKVVPEVAAIVIPLLITILLVLVTEALPPERFKVPEVGLPLPPKLSVNVPELGWMATLLTIIVVFSVALAVAPVLLSISCGVAIDIGAP